MSEYTVAIFQNIFLDGAEVGSVNSVSFVGTVHMPTYEISTKYINLLLGTTIADFRF